MDRHDTGGEEGGEGVGSGGCGVGGRGQSRYNKRTFLMFFKF